MKINIDQFIKDYLPEIILAGVFILIGTFLGPVGIIVVLGAIAWIVWTLIQFVKKQ